MARPEVFIPKPAKTPSRINYDLESAIYTEKTTGKRVIWIPEDFIQSVLAVSSRMLRAGSPAMLYKMGFYWGEAMFKQLESHLLATRPSVKRILDMSVKDFVGFVDEVWAQNGLGRFEVVQNFDMILVNLYHSFVAQVAEKTGKPVDHLYAGLYAGLFSGLLGQKIACIEIMCISSGYDYCRFLLGKEEVLAPVQEWVEQGLPYESILEKLQTLGDAPKA